MLCFCNGYSIEVFHEDLNNLSLRILSPFWGKWDGQLYIKPVKIVNGLMSEEFPLLLKLWLFCCNSSKTTEQLVVLLWYFLSEKQYLLAYCRIILHWREQARLFLCFLSVLSWFLYNISLGDITNDSQQLYYSHICIQTCTVVSTELRNWQQLN